MKMGALITAVFASCLFFAIAPPLFAQEDIEQNRSCAVCGMDRKAFGYSRMLVQYEDGTMKGVCSLHCAAVELDSNHDQKVKALLVADRDSRTLTAAEQAIWVMGGGKRGVMTMQPKWAFQSKAGAEAFIKANGGKIVSWAEAFAAARDEIVQKH